MKKIIALCSLIVCVSVLLTAFVSCSKDKNDVVDSGETNIVSVTNGDFVFTAELGSESVIIKNNGEEYQVLNYPQNAGYTVDLEYAKGHFEFIDMNFDGQPDFYIATRVDGEIIYYYCWLFNATTKKFDFSASLSGLNNISVDAENQIIYSTIHTNGATKIASYVWANGQLALKDVYENESDTIPEEVTQAAQDNAIGTVTKPSKPSTEPVKNTQADKTNPNNNADNNTTSTTKTNDKKPLNTTTTEAHTGGVAIETGNIDEGWF